MNSLFLDLEWGQVYGSYRGHFVPREVGCIISKPGHVAQNFESKKFHYDVNLVIRRNTIDASARTTGFSETVMNPERDEYQKVYDPSFRLKTEDKVLAHRISRRAIRELGSYISLLLQRHDINRLVLFGGTEDLKLLQQGGVFLSKLDITDVQHVIQKETSFCFSLDKIAFIIGFTSDTKRFGAKNVQYRIPTQYRYMIKPHRAIGDVCRIFTAHQEFYHDRNGFINDCKQYLRLHEETKPKTAKTGNGSTHKRTSQDAVPGHTTSTSSESKRTSEETPLARDANSCPRCKKMNTIPHHDGVWCSHCEQPMLAHGHTPSARGTTPTGTLSTKIQYRYEGGTWYIHEVNE